MTPPAVAERAVAEPGAVLARATLGAAARLSVSQSDLARILGVSASSVTRMAQGTRPLDPASKEGELALLFVRLFRSLDALVGGDEDRSTAWLHAENHHLGGVPAERIRTVQGLVDVVTYLDAMRGR